jgi:hypothetical protein
MLVVQRALGHMLLDCRLFMQGSLVRLQITFVCDSTVTVLCLCVWTHGHIRDWTFVQKQKLNKTGLEIQPNLISYNLFSEVGEGVSRVQSTEFDVLFCVWVWTVWLTSRLDV